MSDLSPAASLSVRSGYASRRSPGALAAAVAINGGLFALLVALPATHYVIQRDPPIQVRWVPVDPLPPPEPPEPAKQAEPTIQPRVDHARPPDTVPPVEPFVPIGAGPEIAIGLPPPPGLPGPAIGPRTEPPPPQVVRARPDPRHADAFRPAYPAAMRREGLEGSVTVRVTIDERGRVVAVALVSATSPAFFEETRRQALRAWRFVPARQDGVAIRSEQTMTVHFRLED